MGILSLLKHIGRNLTDGQFVVGVVFISIGLHIDKVDDAADVLLEANREMNGNRVLRKTLVD